MYPTISLIIYSIMGRSAGAKARRPLNRGVRYLECLFNIRGSTIIDFLRLRGIAIALPFLVFFKLIIAIKYETHSYTFKVQAYVVSYIPK